MPALSLSTMSVSYPAVRRIPHGFLLCLAQEPAVFPGAEQRRSTLLVSPCSERLRRTFKAAFQCSTNCDVHQLLYQRHSDVCHLVLTVPTCAMTEAAWGSRCYPVCVTRSPVARRITAELAGCRTGAIHGARQQRRRGRHCRTAGGTGRCCADCCSTGRDHGSTGDRSGFRAAGKWLRFAINHRSGDHRHAACCTWSPPEPKRSALCVVPGVQGLDPGSGSGLC